MPDSEVELPSGFLTTFGRPARESACECERSSGLQLGPVMALVSGPTISDAIGDPNNDVAKLVKTRARRPEAGRRAVPPRSSTGRRPREEIDACLKEFAEIEADHVRLAEALGRRETEVALIRPKLEIRARAADIAAAKAALASYEAELAPKVAEAEKEKAARTAALEKDLKDYEATLPAKVDRVGEGPVDRRPLAPAPAQGAEGPRRRHADGRARRLDRRDRRRTRTASTRSSPRPT